MISCHYTALLYSVSLQSKIKSSHHSTNCVSYARGNYFLELGYVISDISSIRVIKLARERHCIPARHMFHNYFMIIINHKSPRELPDTRFSKIVPKYE